MPAWDLSDLYRRPKSPEVEADFARADQQARSFAATYAGKLAGLAGAALAAAIHEYEQIEEVLGRLRPTPSCCSPAIPPAPRSAASTSRSTSGRPRSASHLLFFTLELNRLDDAVLEAKLADPALARWRPWLRDLRVFRPHQLSDELEKLLHEKEVTGHSAWSRLFDETMAGMRITVGDEALTVSDALNKLSDKDRACGRRLDARSGRGSANG